MVRDLMTAWLLIAACVGIHSVTLTWVLRGLPRLIPPPDAGMWRATRLFIRIAIVLIFAHIAEVMVFGTFYYYYGAFPDLRSCAYFSVITYTTTGYGDLLPPESLRLTAGLEGLTGILMCGWSTGFFFAVVSRIHRIDRHVP